MRYIDTIYSALLSSCGHRHTHCVVPLPNSFPGMKQSKPLRSLIGRDRAGVEDVAVAAVLPLASALIYNPRGACERKAVFTFLYTWHSRFMLLT